MARYSVEHTIKVRALLLEEAQQIIAEQGTNALSVGMLMSRAGMTHGGFYAHFASREDLLLEVVSSICSSIEGVICKFVNPEKGWAGLENFFDVYLSPQHRDTGVGSCPLAMLISDVQHLSPGARRRYKAAHGRFLDAITAVYEQERVPDARSLATETIVQLLGAITLARALGRGAASAELLETSRKVLQGRVSSWRAESAASRN